MFNFLVKATFFLACFLSCICSAQENFLGPTLKSEYIEELESGDIFQGIIETAPRHHRLLNSYTFFIPPENTSGLKFQSDLLLQNIFYPHQTLSQKVWLSQIAGSTSFKKLLTNHVLDSYTLDFYASYSWGKLLKERLYFMPFNGWGVQGGIEKRVPFFNTCIDAWFLYDLLNHSKHGPHSKTIKQHGPGFALSLSHHLKDDLILHNKAVFRVPFNYYESTLHWRLLDNHSIGLFLNKTTAKKFSTSNMGVAWDIKIPIGLKTSNLVSKKAVPNDLKKWGRSSESFYPGIQKKVEILPPKDKKKILEEDETEDLKPGKINFPDKTVVELNFGGDCEIKFPENKNIEIVVEEN